MILMQSVAIREKSIESEFTITTPIEKNQSLLRSIDPFLRHH